MTRIGARLRELREARGERLEDVATATFRSISSISRLENGERLPSESLIDLMADHFGVHRRSLMLLLHDDLRERADRQLERRYRDHVRSQDMSFFDTDPDLPARSETGAMYARAAGTGLSAAGRRRSEQSLDLPVTTESLTAHEPWVTHTTREQALEVALRSIELAATATTPLRESRNRPIRLHALSALLALARPIVAEVDRFIAEERDPEVKAAAQRLRDQAFSGRE